MKAQSILAIAITAVFAAGAAHAQFQERTLRLGNATPKGHPMLKGADTLVQCAATKTGGKMKIQSFTDGVLGNDAQMVSAARTGTLATQGILTSVRQCLLCLKSRSLGRPCRSVSHCSRLLTVELAVELTLRPLFLQCLADLAKQSMSCICFELRREFHMNLELVARAQLCYQYSPEPVPLFWLYKAADTNRCHRPCGTWSRRFRGRIWPRSWRRTWRRRFRWRVWSW